MSGEQLGLLESVVPGAHGSASKGSALLTGADPVPCVTPKNAFPALSEGERRKRAGVALAESRAPSLAETVRQYLKELASDGRSVTIDDARSWMDSLGIAAPSSAWFGCLFRPNEWELVGFTPSERVAKHRHRNSVWRLRRKG